MSTKQLREKELYLPLKNFFEKQEYKVVAEVPIPCWFACCDLVAFNDNEIIAVEMKMSLTKTVIHQAYRNQNNSNKVYAAVSTRPRDLNYASKLGIGVIKVKNNTVEILLESGDFKRQGKYIDQFRQQALSILSNTPNSIGGLPTLKGIGPRIECRKRVTEYLIKNPNASWKEIYKNVKNHYCNYKSMKSAINQ